MLFAGTKLYEEGRRNEAMWEYIRRNSRAARQLQDDLDAQIASARLGVRRFNELVERYGMDTVLTATHQLMDYTERVLRQRIAEIPDGEYRAEGFLDDDGRNRDVRLPIKVCVRVKGDGIEIDLTGSADQVETGFNVPFEGSTKVACFCAIRSLLLDAETSEIKVPSNQGSFRPISVIAPKGSIYNPNFPAAAEARFSQINRVIDLTYKALAPVLPNDIIAGSSATLSFAAYSGLKPDGEYWVFLEVNEGSYGGRPASDGPDCIDSLMANTRNNPLEDLAVHLPMICDRYELRDDVMPGAGRFRSGIGVVKKQRILTDGFITHECDRHEDVPWGIFGGGEGQCGAVEIYNAARPDDITDMPAKFAGLRVSSGDVMAFYGPCGGGYGDPLERPAEKVLEDVLDDFCTVEHARGVRGGGRPRDRDRGHARHRGVAVSDAGRSSAGGAGRFERRGGRVAWRRRWPSAAGGVGGECRGTPGGCLFGRTQAGGTARLYGTASAAASGSISRRLAVRRGSGSTAHRAARHRLELRCPAPSPQRGRHRGPGRAEVERHAGAAHRHLERQRKPAPGGGADRDRVRGGVPVVRAGDAGGGESGLAPRHRRLQRSKSGPHISTRTAGSAASSNRPSRYLAGDADRWVVLPILEGDTGSPGAVVPASTRPTGGSATARKRIRTDLPECTRQGAGGKSIKENARGLENLRNSAWSSVKSERLVHRNRSIVRSDGSHPCSSREVCNSTHVCKIRSSGAAPAGNAANGYILLSYRDLR